MGKIYTKKGDQGRTKTFHGKMSKADPLAEALGSIDELNSWLGWCRGQVSVGTTLSDPPPKLGGGRKGGGIGKELKNVQANLLLIGSLLAGSTKEYRILNTETKKLEKEIDKMTKELPELANFIYPTGPFQIARTVCRRAECAVVRIIIHDVRFKNKPVIKYLNRLSDYLFVLARWVNFKTGVKEEVWNKK